MNKMNNYKKFYEMLFIYNAVLNGWTVKKLQNRKFKFTNNKRNLKINLKDVNINTFVKDNLTLDIF
tara:strand:- start:292 stop:489 length:198 start_codon:yes stop_codon:yes gene_type:complete